MSLVSVITANPASPLETVAKPQDVALTGPGASPEIQEAMTPEVLPMVESEKHVSAFSIVEPTTVTTARIVERTIRVYGLLRQLHGIIEPIDYQAETEPENKGLTSSLAFIDGTLAQGEIHLSRMIAAHQ